MAERRAEYGHGYPNMFGQPAATGIGYPQQQYSGYGQQEWQSQAQGQAHWGDGGGAVGVHSLSPFIFSCVLVKRFSISVALCFDIAIASTLATQLPFP